MPKIVKPLTDTQLTKAKAQDKAYTLADGQGMHLLIKPNKTKIWEFIYTQPNTKRRRKTTFGNYPDVTLALAREKREKYRNLIFKEIDPIDYYREIKNKENNNTEGLFENVVKDWLKGRKKELVKRSYQRIESLLLNDVVIYLKDINIKDIKHSKISEIIQIKNEKAPESAKRLLQYLYRIWKYAITKGYVEFNIIANIDASSIITKKQVIHYAKIVNLTILEELVNAIYNYTGHYSVKNALKLVLHLPLRASNLIALRWDYIDFDNKLLTIPRSEMKMKDSELDDFIMPLTDEIINILKEQLVYTANRKYIFISDNGKHINAETPNRALQRLGFNDEKRGRKQRLHSFRGTFRSLADTYQLQHNATFETKEIALDHQVGNAVSQAYNDKANYQEQLKLLMNWWSNFIVKMVDEVSK